MLSIKAYILLYHEAVVLNLLENFFFYVTACQAAEDYIVDIIEYCYGKLTKLVTNTNIPNKTEEKDKFEEIEVTLRMSCISILRYITDHLMQLPFPVRYHIMNIKDVPMLLVALMESKPWIRKQEDKSEEVYENNQWIKYTFTSKLPKLEAQVWIMIHNLFMNQENSKKYEITDNRKTQLLRLRKYMNDALFDQIQPLQQLYRALEEMNIMDNQGGNMLGGKSSVFVVEMVPTLFNSFRKIPEIKLKEIAENALNEYFRNQNSEEKRREVEIISDVFNNQTLEYFMEDPKCANCGREATNRCSRCKSEWYCGKDCQVKKWKSHKEFCSKLAELYQENDATSNSKAEETLKVVKETKITEKEKKFDELD
jgi:predicted Zn-ribbon and HTH transcriptional regulator